MTTICIFHLLIRPAYFFFWQTHITQTREMNAPWVINAVHRMKELPWEVIIMAPSATTTHVPKNIARTWFLHNRPQRSKKLRCLGIQLLNEARWNVKRRREWTWHHQRLRYETTYTKPSLHDTHKLTYIVSSIDVEFDFTILWQGSQTQNVSVCQTYIQFMASVTDMDVRPEFNANGNPQRSSFSFQSGWHEAGVSKKQVTCHRPHPQAVLVPHLHSF